MPITGTRCKTATIKRGRHDARDYRGLRFCFIKSVKWQLKEFAFIKRKPCSTENYNGHDDGNNNNNIQNIDRLYSLLAIKLRTINLEQNYQH